AQGCRGGGLHHPELVRLEQRWPMGRRLGACQRSLLDPRRLCPDYVLEDVRAGTGASATRDAASSSRQSADASRVPHCARHALLLEDRRPPRAGVCESRSTTDESRTPTFRRATPAGLTTGSWT